jgi:hypothetical protein
VHCTVFKRHSHRIVSLEEKEQSIEAEMEASRNNKLDPLLYVLTTPHNLALVSQFGRIESNKNLHFVNLALAQTVYKALALRSVVCVRAAGDTYPRGWHRTYCTG